MIPNISFGFSFFISSLDIFSVLSFKLLHLFLISSTSSLFFFLSFVSNIFFAKSIGSEKLKYFLNQSLFMSFHSLSIKAMALLMNPSFVSSFISSDFSSFVLNTLPLYGKDPFPKEPIISYLAPNNFIADFRTLFFSSIFFYFLCCSFLVYLLTFLISLDHPLLHLE